MITRVVHGSMSLFCMRAPADGGIFEIFLTVAKRIVLILTIRNQNTQGVSKPRIPLTAPTLVSAGEKAWCWLYAVRVPEAALPAGP